MSIFAAGKIANKHLLFNRRKYNNMKKIFSTVFIAVILLLLTVQCTSGGSKRTPPPKEDEIESVPNQPIQDVNVYLENSGSMNGYVKGNTGFEQTLYAFLTELRIAKLVDTLNLNYINSRVIPLGHDAEHFIHHIEPIDFKNRGGNLGTSDIAIVLDTVLTRHKKHDVSIFISDCIVSPGRKYAQSSPQSLDNYLIEQRTDIRNSFSMALDKADGDLAVVICQLTSLFDGTFYNKFDDGRYYKGSRPFYIWMVGSTAHVKQLLDLGTLDELRKNGAELEHVYTLTASSEKVDYNILLMPRLGRFDLDRKNPRTTICNIRKETKGEQKGMFMFSVGADLSHLPLDASYMADVDNYEVNNKDYFLSVKEQKSAQFSHVFSLSSKVASRGHITIALKNQFPQWVSDNTDFLGSDLVKDGATDKTYGLQYLIKGVYDAFATRQKDYAEIKITIN